MVQTQVVFLFFMDVHFCLYIYHFNTALFVHLWWNRLDTFERVYSRLCILFHYVLWPFFHQYHIVSIQCFRVCFIINLDTLENEFSNVFLNYFDYSSSYVFPYNFRISLSISFKNFWLNFHWDYAPFIDQLQRIDIFIILSLPIHKHWIPLYLLMSSLIYLNV